MPRRLTGKVAVITGAASGLGAASARRFVAEGARVVIADIQADKGQSVVESLGTAARFCRCDVRDESDVRAAVEMAVDEFGGLDSMLHLAAAGGVQDRIEQMDVDAWDATQAQITRASLLVIKCSIPHLRARGGGSVTLTSSVAGLRPAVSAPAGYATFKAALSGLLQVAATQCAPDLIRVNMIVPGAVPTPMHLTRRGYSQELADAMAPHLGALLFQRMQPLPRAGRADDIAGAAVYLASDDASFVTGVELPVDGGLMLHRLTTPDDFGEAMRNAESIARAELSRSRVP